MENQLDSTAAYLRDKREVLIAVRKILEILEDKIFLLKKMISEESAFERKFKVEDSSS